ncbi:uncharacterized protein I303_105868 [Kwoniella dejecticola CBS 10117]|uniref:D-lactaldehyde dehydrogenase n=1 Tax=Kwoniella dejecticola CBS 10117 TaxID=1296121 RepID=A0A1A6A0L7_9TREE|nr:D-lactaldehyde dehydrogenase [Kwoniella dejecticola CBS 10117]OBR83609.1 D-lactaldehyde dehydrogenase [Kwoniella dejecticola CBS 10117]
MGVITKGDLILVSGASGFIASHTAKQLLQKGYKVRGTVRSEAKGEYLKDLFKGLGDFEYALVDDITKDGVFDEAVKGVDAVAHLASPFYTEGVKDPQELIGPAVKGTTGILKSIQKNNPDLKRVVITSSVASIMSTDSRPAPNLYTEEDWNQDSIPHVEKNGVKSTGGHSYQASKTLAEKALWKFIEDEKPSWDAAAINPPLVLGEVIHQVDSPEKLNTSVAYLWQWLSGKKSESDLPGPLGNWVDVKDVAEAHIRALEVVEASGQRFITGAGYLLGQAIVDGIHKRFPDAKNVPVGKPGEYEETTSKMNLFNGDKAKKVLGINYKSLEQSTYETGESLFKKFGH